MKIDKDNLYNHILDQIKKVKADKDGNKVLKQCFEDISRDINRTFHVDRFLEKSGLQELTNVLEALSFINTEIGYCQGMNFIAGTLIYIFDSDEKAFWAFLALLKNYEISQLYTRNMPDYDLRVFQLNHYVKLYFPDIYYHFKNNKIPFDLLYSKWFITLFSSYLNFEVTSHSWMYFILVRRIIYKG
jgi:hypothetical protein